MSAFKPTESRDGLFRATIREPLRVDLTYVVMALIEEDSSSGRKRLTRHKLGQIVRKAVRDWGWHLYDRSERQADNHYPEDHDGMEYEDYYKSVEQRVIEIYPEFKERA